LETQEGVIRGYAMTRGAKHDEVEMFVDRGVSGGTLLRKRPEGALLLKTAKRGDTVIASKLDRMFRNSTDALVTAEELKERGVHLVLFDLGADPITGDGMAKLVFTIFAALADAERTRICERLAEGRAAKKAKRGLSNGTAPFGYRKIGLGRDSRIEVCPDEQALIKRVKHHIANKSPSMVARDLAAAGVRNRKGKPFAPWALTVISRLELAQVQ
jgi:DNA invertase Pin-like site-specific DNA recombinase